MSGFLPTTAQKLLLELKWCPAEQQDQGGMENDSLHFWLTSPGATGCLVTLAMPVTRASHAEGAGSGTAALPARTKPRPQAELSPSTLAVASGCHPAPGWRHGVSLARISMKGRRKALIVPSVPAWLQDHCAGTLCPQNVSRLVQASRDVFSAYVPVCGGVEPPRKVGLATHTLVFICTPVFPLAREVGGRK